MKYCDIKNPPVFDLQIEKWDKTTRDNGEELAVPIEKLFNNSLFNKGGIDMLKGKILKGITIPANGWNNLTFTIADPVFANSSSVTIGFAFDSILPAQKANIRGKLEPGKLVLVANKIPTVNLLIEELRIINLD